MLGKVEELLVVLVIVLVLFGGKKLPQLARGIGESVREVRKGFSGNTTEEPAEPVKKAGTQNKSA
jgi:sec-independent protein translocase protein TatA